MKKIIVFLLFLQCCEGSIQAQDTLSFKACLAIAFENNLSLKEAFLEEKLSSIQYSKSKKDVYPNLNATVTNSNAFGRSIDPYSNSYVDTKFKTYAGDIGGAMVLFNGFSKRNSIRLAKAEIALNQTGIDKIKDDITLELASLYTTILYTEELIKANREQIELSNQQMEIIQLRFKEGLIAESELFKIKAQLASEEVSLLTAVNTAQLYYLDLNQLLNLPVSTVQYLKPMDIDSSNEFLQELSLLNVEEAYVNLPDYLLAKMKEEKEKLNSKLAKAAYLPTLNLQFNYGSFYSNSTSDFDFSEQWDNNKSYGFNFVLSIPIMNGFLVRSASRKAKVDYEHSVLRSEMEKNRLIKVLTKANYDAQTSFEKLKSASTALHYAQKNVEADQLKFEYGKISLTELLLVQKEFFNNRAAWIKAKYEYAYNMGVIRFYRDNTFAF